MSLILDALNKAQRERQEERQPVPQLSTVHHAPAAFERPPLRGGMLPWLALAVIVAGALLLAILKAMAPAEVPAPTPLTAELQPPISVTQVPDSAADSGHAGTNAAAVPTSAQAASQRRPEPTAGDTTTATPTIAEVNELYRVADNPVEKGPAEKDPAVPSSDSVPPQNPGEPVAAQPEQQAPTVAEPAPAQEASLDDYPNIPSVDQLSWSTQQTLPSILYSVHHYEANPANRLVEINSRTLRTAGSIAEGLVLEEILSDGVILRFRSQRFKLPALNSWVNF